jgi:tripartite-type tricarboxylate transporter receptor subunit TctC
MSALPPKADIGTQPLNVRFLPKADILRCSGDLLLGATLHRKAHGCLIDFHASAKGSNLIVEMRTRWGIMKIPRRLFLHLAVGATALPALPRVASALDYPTRPVRLIAPFPPGGVVDLFARLIGQPLSERLGQPVVIENRAGAGGNVGTEFVVRAPPDGYTLLYLTSSNTINQTLYENLNFDIARDMVPIASINRGMGVLEVHPSFPAETGPEFIAYAKANPGKINYASSGIGSSPHIYGELFKMMAGVDMVAVQYRGTGPALPDVLSGKVPVMFDTLATSIEHIKAGRLRALGVTAANRSPVLPDVPAIREFVPGYEATGWAGIGAPRNTPVEIVERLHREINACVADSRFSTRTIELGYTPFASTREEFSRFVVESTEKWAKVIRAANIRVE